MEAERTNCPTLYEVTLCILSHLKLTASPEVEIAYYLHFPDEETDVQHLKNLLKTTQLIRERAKI